MRQPKKITPEGRVKIDSIDLMCKLGIRSWPIAAGPFSLKGLPDRFFFLPVSGLIGLVEFKSSKGKLSPDQVEFARQIPGSLYFVAHSLEEFIFLLSQDSRIHAGISASAQSLLASAVIAYGVTEPAKFPDKGEK